MSIVTKTGDDGSTSLWGGSRISKAADFIEAIGDVDELNSVIGLIRAELNDRKIDQTLEKIQSSCFVIGAEVSSIRAEKSVRDQAIPEIGFEDLKLIDEEIINLEKKLPELKNFILPAGSRISSLFFFTRAICRRAERSIVRLNEEKLQLTQQFLNRLSDLLFLLARQNNQKQEVLWKGKR